MLKNKTGIKFLPVKQGMQTMIACFIVGIFWLAGCNNGQTEIDKTKLPIIKFTHQDSMRRDSIAKARLAIDSAEYYTLFKNKTNVWLYKVLQNKRNKWADFTLMDFLGKDSLASFNYTPTDSFYRKYAMFLEWSPDSARLLDYGSQGLAMAKDKGGRFYVESTNGRQQIALVNYHAKTKAALHFLGAKSAVWGAHWIDTGQVAMIGEEKFAFKKQLDTVLWIFNINNGHYRRYVYSSAND